MEPSNRRVVWGPTTFLGRGEPTRDTDVDDVEEEDHIL